ncbi:MAG: MlaD family protein [Gammaproteobacteria bacterium]|nr:MlaD family protein [Gammaproteobacteria bacterium]
METNVNYTVVGVFVIVLLSAVIFGILWLSAGLSMEGHVVYEIYMKESVSGLNVDSQVEFNGVDVGTVKSISLNDKNPQLVELLLNVNTKTPITEGTTATLTTKGLTGTAYIQLQDKGLDTRPLKVMDGQMYPVIKTTPSLFLRLDTALSDLSSNIHQVANSIKSVLDPENQRMIKGTLKNMDRLSEALAGNSQQLNTILHNSAKASQQFSGLLQNGSETMMNLNNTATNFSTLSGEIKQNPAVLIRGKEPQPLGPGE